MKFAIKLILILTTINIAKSQNYSQFQSSPQYYNPAFSSINKCTNILSKNQYQHIAPGIFYIQNSIITDFFIPKLSSALKLSAENFHFSDKIFNINRFRFSYSYHLNLDKKNHISFGIETEYFQEKFSANNLIYPSMLDAYGNISNSVPQYTNSLAVSNLIFNAGIVFWQKDFYFSAYTNNLYSIYFGDKAPENSNLGFMFERKNILKNDEKYFTINTAIFAKKNYYNLYFGSTINYKSLQIGIFEKISQTPVRTAVGTILSLAIALNKIKITYSAEIFYVNLPVNKPLSNELTIQFLINCDEKKAKNTIICPAYEL